MDDGFPREHDGSHNADGTEDYHYHVFHMRSALTWFS